VQLPELTHHVGLGTFRPVEVEDLSKHKMDSEQYFMPQSTADVVNQALSNKRRVCAVGTTTVRTLESSLTTGGRVTGNTGWTNKFIFPPYEIQIPDSMITNFHPPGSTLLMMNSAMVGHELAMHAINEAIKEKYRFLAFGDAMLII
jgi:S-adenosylmethionine:tRNA ribosyltransferase-isomerase